MTTGLSSRECLAALAAQGARMASGGGGGDGGATVVGAACLIDRSGGKADLGVPLVALASLDIPAYAPDRLPPELAALPAVKPGSRSIVQ